MTEQHPEQHEHHTGEHRSPAGHHGDLGAALGLSHDDDGGDHRKGGPKRAGGGCLLLVILIALMGGIAYVGLTKGVDWARDQFAEAEDYPGPGTTRVLVEVSTGDTSGAVADTLVEEDVVASREAFMTIALARSEEAASIQAGFYEMKREMAAKDAFDLLVDPANIRTSSVTIPEGLRVVDVVDILVKKTKFKRAQFEKVLANPEQLGLPAYAKGEPEGYLFPATYAFSPKAKPADMLKQMVDRWRQAAADNDLEAKAAELGKTPAEIMIIASLVQAEGRGTDMNKIARVIYNRLDGPGNKGGTNGTLGIDASNAYGIGKSGTTALTESDLARSRETPYDTRSRPGLPPTPISVPGDEAIQAATHPAEGDWYYYVTVNLRTGETKFAETHDEFLTYKAEYADYCATQSDRC